MRIGRDVAKTGQLRFTDRKMRTNPTFKRSISGFFCFFRRALMVGWHGLAIHPHPKATNLTLQAHEGNHQRSKFACMDSLPPRQFEGGLSLMKANFARLGGKANASSRPRIGDQGMTPCDVPPAKALVKLGAATAGKPPRWLNSKHLAAAPTGLRDLRPEQAPYRNGCRHHPTLAPGVDAPRGRSASGRTPPGTP